MVCLVDVKSGNTQCESDSLGCGHSASFMRVVAEDYDFIYNGRMAHVINLNFILNHLWRTL